MHLAASVDDFSREARRYLHRRQRQTTPSGNTSADLPPRSVGNHLPRINISHPKYKQELPVVEAYTGSLQNRV